MNICVICTNYPSVNNPKHVFLEKLVKEFVDLGNTCTVIAPQVRSKNCLLRKLNCVYVTDRGNKYKVYSPIYKSFSGRKIGPIHLGVLTHESLFNAVRKVYVEQSISCDVFYSHFISAGVVAHRMSCEYNKPFFIANGESNLLDFIRTLPKKAVFNTYKKVSAIISVSTANKEEVINSGYFPEEQNDKIFVVPNAINSRLFYKEDKKESRERLGFPQDRFIIAFVGSFSERKGSKRVEEAICDLEDVSSIFIGSGAEMPNHSNCLFMGRVDNSELRHYLSAADVFVLPTRNEGCCNAIVEALACGLPVISSDLPFNYDILDDECSLLIDPNDINQIRNAIIRLKDDNNLRSDFSKHALEKVRPFELITRAETIIEIMNTNIS